MDTSYLRKGMCVFAINTLYRYVGLSVFYNILYVLSASPLCSLWIYHVVT